jgi:tetratricopeptide (TPR) repeat protein
MRNPAEEAALLEALASLLVHFEMTVTFNGRTFDLPLLRTRFRQNRETLSASAANVPLLAEDQSHLDLLHPARRLWRRRLQSCRLINLEQKILHLERSEDDVPGHQIPALYSEYMRSQDATQMRRVFYHNGEDIISMVAIAERLSRAFAAPPAHQSNRDLTGLDWLALGQSYEKLQEFEHAEVAYRRALDHIGEPQERAQAFLSLGRVQKRQGRWQEASDTWQLWLTSVPGNDPTPYVELAKYCEWQLYDYEQAEMWTAWALHNVSTDHLQPMHASTIAELEHRRRRLRRKLRSSSTLLAAQTAPEE